MIRNNNKKLLRLRKIVKSRKGRRALKISRKQGRRKNRLVALVAMSSKRF